MNSHQRLFGERPLHGVIASALVALAIAAYGAWCAHNVTQATANAFSTGLAVLRVVPAPKPVLPQIAQTVIRTNKSDKGVFYDAEAAGDIASEKIAAEDKNSSEHKLARLN
jgi:hypothetical protein